MKYVHLLVALVFIYFAFMQLDDSDSWKWLLIYLSVAIMAFMKFADRNIQRLSLFLSGFLGCLLIINFKLLNAWLQAGMPSFINYEAANITQVEYIREFLGIALSFLTVIVYHIYDKKQKRKGLHRN